jgi:hypothetical protein
MKRFLPLLLSLLALPLQAELRGAARAGIFVGSGNDVVGTIELDARRGNWSLAPAFDLIRGGHGLYAVHVDVRRHFSTGDNTFWIGVGPTFVKSNESSETTFNVDAGVAFRKDSVWQPFVAARYYSFELPVFRDVIEGHGAVISAGISRRFD